MGVSQYIIGLAHMGLNFFNCGEEQNSHHHQQESLEHCKLQHCPGQQTHPHES